MIKLKEKAAAVTVARKHIQLDKSYQSHSLVSIKNRCLKYEGWFSILLHEAAEHAAKSGKLKAEAYFKKLINHYHYHIKVKGGLL